MSLSPKILSPINKLKLLPPLLWQKSFWPWIFRSDVVPFQTRKLGAFFPWMTIQANESSLLCVIISVFYLPMKQTYTVRTCKIDPFFFFHLFTQSMQLSLRKGILCKALQHPKQYTNLACCKKRRLSLSVCACFAREMMSESKLDPF